MSMVNREQLITDLRNCIAEVRLNRGNGVVGILTATLLPHYLPPGTNMLEEVNKDHDLEVIALWDVGGNQWRSLRLEWIVSVQQKDAA